MERLSDQHKVFTPSGCLTQEALQAYVKGHCSPEVLRKIEIHLTDCPLCSDATEGFAEEPGNLSALSRLDNIRKQLFQEKEEETRVIPLIAPVKKTKNRQILYISIAASFILVCTSFFAIRYLVMNSQQDQVSMTAYQETDKSENTGETAEEAVPDAAGQIISDSMSPRKDMTDHNRNNKDIPDPVKEGAKGGTVIMPGTLDMIADDETYKSIVNEVYFSVDADLGLVELPVEEKQVVASEDENKLPEQTKNKETDKVEQTVAGTRTNGATGKTQKKSEVQQAPASATGDARDELNSGMESYREGDYSGAAEKFDRALVNEPDQAQALYYSGMSYFYTGDYDQALQMFGKVVKNRKSSYYHAARWQISVIQIRQGKTQEARKTLNAIIDEDSPYRKQAEEEIELLNK